jgi:hypothetical protein
MLLDANGRYVLVTRFEGDDRSLSIVDWKNHRACSLPSNVEQFERPLVGPKDRRSRSPIFWLPVIVRQDEDTRVLQFVDERCTLQEPFGKFGNSAGRPSLDEDGRELLLFGDGDGNLSLADPWFGETLLIAAKVRAVASVAQIADEPQALWLLENDKLTQRTLDGTLLVSLGETQVTAFSQTINNGLRVAYVDGGDLYEAIGPDFEPVLVVRDGCEPAYRNGFLDLYTPCAERQLVRILIFTSKVQEFEPGVFISYDEGNYTFEYVRDENDKTHLFVEPPGRERVEIDPVFVGRPMIIDSSHLAGLIDVVDSEGNKSRSFVIWSPTEPLQDLFQNVAEIYPFVDLRSSSFLWLMHHEVVDGYGTLSAFTQRNLALQRVSRDTPLRVPLENSNVRGYSIEQLPTLPEPLLVLITNGRPLERDPKAFRGTLHARMLSGALGSKIDDDVSSYAVVGTPLPGVIYGIEEGDEPGLWFAAF